jgi:AraC-like DNA-binding protein
MPSGEFAFSWFSISLDHLFPLFALGEIPLLQDIPIALRNSKVYPSGSPLALQCHRLLDEIGPQFDLNHRSQLLRVAALLLSSEFKSAKGRRGGFVRAEDHLIQVFEKLSAEEILNLSVEELSRKFSCSRRHLSRLFHQHFGLSVAALRMEMRLLKAVSLLRDPDVKVINVAEHCGFNHLGLFNTCFKRRFGVTPGQWRNMTRDKDQSGKPTKAMEACPLRVSGLCPWNGKGEEPSQQPLRTVQCQADGRSLSVISAEQQYTPAPALPKAEKAPVQSFSSVPRVGPAMGHQVT